MRTEWLAALVLLAPASAAAGEGFVGVYDHDLDMQVAAGGYEDGAQIVVGYRSAPLEALGPLGRPSLYAFGAANTAGETNYAAAGLSWRIAFGERLYVRPGFGVAVHDGEVDLPYPQNIRQLDLGSRFTFAPEIAAGWRLSDRWAAELSWVHLSHAQLGGEQNPGLDDVGVRLVRRFGPD